MPIEGFKSIIRDAFKVFENSDLDILIFGKEIIQDKKLTIPHSEIEKRPFVLVPLAEIDSNCSIPGVGVISDLLAVNDQKDLELLHE